MTVNELRANLANTNTNYFIFTTPVEESRLVSRFIHDASFDTITFSNNRESVVVV